MTPSSSLLTVWEIPSREYIAKSQRPLSNFYSRGLRRIAKYSQAGLSLTSSCNRLYETQCEFEIVKMMSLDE